ncbi:hypothetical protein Cni_G28056 [Canna indica]|uniref:Uncharacterized protein n=1 Tax=Canna indica TaxID=4628 RepID=A0AAQ3QRY6_9LILI|nr:hypothetical protein Cni_G28056 [Canna indica]
MGVPFSVLGKLGMPSVDSFTADQVYDKFFSEVTEFEKFHINFLTFCSALNTIMPGKHYKIDAETLKKFHDEWSKISKTDSDKKKKELLEFLKKNVEDYKPNSAAMIGTGFVAPVAAIVLKRSGEKVPQLKKLRIDLVPNFVFVPGFTLLSLIGVRMLNMSKATSKLTATKTTTTTKTK